MDKNDEKVVMRYATPLEIALLTATSNTRRKLIKRKFKKGEWQ